jgi:L-ascorbate metabolism protein UlaG (beta-lactamase superfamily)
VFPAVSLLFFSAGCLTRPLVKPPGDPEKGVTVRWWGHSCFSLRDSEGREFLIDPFDDTVGYPVPKRKPDAVLVTHEHFDHDAVPGPRMAASPPAKKEGERAPGKPSIPGPPSGPPVVRSTGTHTVAGIEVTGVLMEHDDEGGRRHGFTRAYVWSMGGLRFAHLGDIGQRALRPEQREALGEVDVLFIPVGGKTTVDADGAAGLVAAIAPRVVVPMHYGNRWVRFFVFDSLTPFLNLCERVRILPRPDFLVRRADLPPDPTVYVPAPPAETAEEKP